MRRLAVVLASVSILLSEGCAASLDPIHPPVPPPLPERVTAPPASSSVLIWRPGHYDWNGSSYAWIPGEWVARAGHGALWQDGYWRRSGGTSVWVPGHWI